MRVLFLGGKQAGVIGLLTVISWGCKIIGVVTTSDILRSVASALSLPTYNSIKTDSVRPLIRESELLISVHSREILPNEILNIPRLGGINVHPCLYAYKGADPVNRFLAGSEPMASVGVHHMTENVDCGSVITELYLPIDRDTIKTAAEVYNELYPLYSMALIEALNGL